MIVYASSHTLPAIQFVSRINEVIFFPLITLLTVIALVIFLYGLLEYVLGAASEDKRAQGSKHILWGLIGMLIMLGAYSILTIAANTFGIDVPDPIRSSPFAPDTAPAPTPRPDGLGAVLPDGSAPSDCRIYSYGGCTPSINSDPYRALREEIQFTGGIADGTTGLMAVGAVIYDEGGNVEIARDFMNEYRSRDWVSQETYDRVMQAIDEKENSFSRENVLNTLDDTNFRDSVNSALDQAVVEETQNREAITTTDSASAGTVETQELGPPGS